MFLGLLAVVCAFIALFFIRTILMPSTPDAATTYCLDGAIPRSSVIYSKRITSGVDATFVAVIKSQGVTNWSGLFTNLMPVGPVRSDPRPTDTGLQDTWAGLAPYFSDYPYFPSSNALNGFVASGGFLKGRPYVLTALVSSTNAFIMLGKY
jgi:hypothetical protein